jgi:uncharacterized protein YceK
LEENQSCSTFFRVYLFVKLWKSGFDYTDILKCYGEFFQEFYTSKTFRIGVYFYPQLFIEAITNGVGMKKILLMLAMAMLLGGCSTTPKVWTKQGATQEEFKRDNDECVRQSRVSWSGGQTDEIGLASAKLQANKLYKMCMESKGYTLVDKPTQEPIEQSQTYR